MAAAIIALGIGYFVTYKVPDILNLKGKTSTIIKIIGIIFLIMGFISFVKCVSGYLSTIIGK